MTTWLRFCGSLTFAILLISVLGILLIVSTCLESAHGTPFAQRFVYQSGWFDVFLALFGLNLVVSALLRWPFKKSHTGFLVTHLGIVLLLAGSLLSRLLGVEGQMMLYEGESSDRIIQSGHTLKIHTVDHKESAFALSPDSSGKSYPLSRPGMKLAIHRVLERAAETYDVREASGMSLLNRAVEVRLWSESLGFDRTFWLVEKHPFDPHARRVSIGAATVEIGEAPLPQAAGDAEPAVPSLGVVVRPGMEVVWTPLLPPPPAEIPVGSSGLRIRNLRYFPDARVGDGNTLVTVSEEPRNPAVQFEVLDAEGRTERYTRFALYPDFEATHGAVSAKAFDLLVELKVPKTVQPETRGASLLLYPTDTGWGYESRSSKREPLRGTVTVGKAQEAGWMDFSFEVKRALDRAEVKKTVSEVPKPEGSVAAEISVETPKGSSQKTWILLDRPEKLETPEEAVVASIEPRTRTVPFKLALKDFRKVDYPGTRNAASYESDVALRDDAENLTIEKTIKMNQPLDYLGYRIFQSSFVQDSGSGEASVFTVAKNPGITLIYSGSVVMFVGILLVFYIRPLSSVKNGKSDARR